MKTTIQQEVLLITGTSFSSRQCWQQNEVDNQKYTPEAEQLQEACWNGLLNDMLPEICSQDLGNRKIYLWRIRENRSGIEIEMGEFPEEIEKDFSIDPYSFLPLQLMS
jgi:hypothetical protein